MWLEVHNCESRVARSTELEIAWVDNFLGYTDPKAHYRRFNKGGRRSLFNVMSHTFPTGLLPLVQAEAAKEGHTIQLIDRRVVPCGVDPKADIAWLADYQDEAVEHAVDKRRGIFWCPTGAGKTEIIVALALVLPCTWGVFVPAKSLLEEFALRFEQRTGEAAGRIGDGQWNPKRFTVATFQTVYRGILKKDPKVLAWLDSLQAIDVDEMQSLPADSFWQVPMAAKNAYYRFGNSATPFARDDRKGLLSIAALGPTLCRIEQKTLVALGAIAEGKVHLVKHAVARVTANHCTETWANYNDAYTANVVENDARNAFVLGVVKAAAKPAFVFVRRLEHGERLVKMLNAAGIQSEFVFGAKHTKVREAAVRRLEHGDTDVIVCNVVFQAGVNVPSLASVVNAAGGKSHIAALQQVGRGSRRRDRTGAVVKDEFSAYDIYDVNCGCKHKSAITGKAKYAHAACKWLETHARSRRRAYISEGYSVVEMDSV